LTTARLELVPLDVDRDASSLHSMLGDPAMYEFAHGSPTGNVTQTRAVLAEELAGNGGWTWAIRVRPSDDAIGTVGLFYDHGTAIRGLDWKLRRDHWGRGIMGEAARAAIDHLLAQPGIEAVEAWIDSRNVRSLGVARRAGLDERSRLARAYDQRAAQSVVMVRAAEPCDPDTLAIRAAVPVRDLEESISLLTTILGLHVSFRLGEPPNFAGLGVGPWSGSPGVRLRVTHDPIAPSEIAVDIGISTDAVFRRAIEAGVDIVEPVSDKPWYRREFAFTLPEGHRVNVSGPVG